MYVTLKYYKNNQISYTVKYKSNSKQHVVKIIMSVIIIYGTVIKFIR